jgi:hypothetical protein
MFCSFFFSQRVVRVRIALRLELCLLSACVRFGLRGCDLLCACTCQTSRLGGVSRLPDFVGTCVLCGGVPLVVSACAGVLLECFILRACSARVLCAHARARLLISTCSRLFRRVCALALFAYLLCSECAVCALCAGRVPLLEVCVCRCSRCVCASDSCSVRRVYACFVCVCAFGSARVSFGNCFSALRVCARLLCFVCVCVCACLLCSESVCA